jgi:predicted nucleic acid-binding Zn ribbon protein
LQKLDSEKQLALDQQQRQQQQQKQQQEILLKSTQQKQKNKTYLVIGAIALILGIIVYKKIKK